MMMPACADCGRVEAMTRSCPTCGEPLYDLSLPADQEALDEYRQAVARGHHKAIALRGVPVLWGTSAALGLAALLANSAPLLMLSLSVLFGSLFWMGAFDDGESTP